MARNFRLARFHRVLRTRRARWGLAAALALLGLLLGAQRLGGHQLIGAARLAGHAFAQAARLALDAGWLLLLLAAVSLALGLVLSSRRGRGVFQWLTTQPVRWGAAATGALGFLVLVVAVLPPRFTAHYEFDKASDELKAQNDVRATLLQALAGGVLLLGASFTYRQLRVTREGQITDRYTRAVDQLGSEHLDVRLGGIYALERIARDSPHDRATIEAVLTAYVRGHAPWPVPPMPLSLRVITQRLGTLARGRRSALQRRTAKDTSGQQQRDRPDEKVAEPPGPAADVQTAMTVLGYRRLPPDGLRQLELTRVDLRRVRLGSANLRGARLSGANLEGARLLGSDLQGARLDNAKLQGAELTIANLQRAGLLGADLRGALLLKANLQLALLSRADLQGADLNGANLQGVRLSGANLQGARLSGADLQVAWLSGADLQGADLGGANLQGAVLGGANLQGAVLTDANLQKAWVDAATRWPDGFDPQTAGVTIGDGQIHLVHITDVGVQSGRAGRRRFQQNRQLG